MLALHTGVKVCVCLKTLRLKGQIWLWTPLEWTPNPNELHNPPLLPTPYTVERNAAYLIQPGNLKNNVNDSPQ